jgi:membrane associated rhomboid family serine protease
MYYFFYLPIGSDITRRRPTVVTPILVAANIAAYVVTHTGAISPILFYFLSFRPDTPALINAFTACFLHVGLLHLVGNMIYLALLGAAVEDRLGRARFLAVYLLSGSFGMVAQMFIISLKAPEAASPVVGASGAIAGILGALLVRLPHAQVRVASAVLLMLHGVHKVGVRFVPGILAVAVWSGLQLAYALAMPAARTAYWSHLGGLVAGALLVLAGGNWQAGQLERRIRKGQRYMQRGSWYAAVGEFETAIKMGASLDPEVLATYARALVAAGRRRAAIDTFRQAVAIELERGEDDSAAELYLELERLLPASVLEPTAQLEIAGIIRRKGEFEAAALALLDFARAYPGHPQAEMARLLSAEISVELLGDIERAATLFGQVDVRTLSPRWRGHVLARRQGAGRRAPPTDPSVEAA